MVDSQSFADYARKTLRGASSKVLPMKKSLNQVLAENLNRLMGTKWNNTSLGKEAKIAPNTIKNYRNPNRDGFANTGDLERLAGALGVGVAALITEHTAEGQPASSEQGDSEVSLQMDMVAEALSMLSSVQARFGGLFCVSTYLSK